MNGEWSFVVPFAGQNLKFFALNAEDDAVGLVDADTPPAAQVVAERLRIADAGDAVAVDALQKQVDALESLGVLSLPSKIFFPSIVMPDLTHGQGLRRQSTHARMRSCEDPFRGRDVRVRAGWVRNRRDRRESQTAACRAGGTAE